MVWSLPLSPSSSFLWYWGRGRSLYFPVPLLCGMGESLYLQAPLPCGTGKSYRQAPSSLGMIPLRNVLCSKIELSQILHHSQVGCYESTHSLSVSLGIVDNNNQEGELLKCLCYQYSVGFCKCFCSPKTRVFNLG